MKSDENLSEQNVPSDTWIGPCGYAGHEGLDYGRFQTVKYKRFSPPILVVIGPKRPSSYAVRCRQLTSWLRSGHRSRCAVHGYTALD
jgi:hypothetical protein